MCLGVPGRVLDTRTDETGMRVGRVEFGGVVRECCLACVPGAGPGAWVMVHVGFAISLLDEAEAMKTLALLREITDTDALPG